MIAAMLATTMTSAEMMNNAVSSAGPGQIDGKMREHYDKLANERAQSLAEASLLKA